MSKEETTKNTFIKEAIPYLIIIVVVVIIRTYFVTPVMVDGTSMTPTLADNNVLILNKRAQIKRYDIVVIKTDEGETLIKRVMALPGETIECIDEKILVDGNIIEDKTEILTKNFEQIKMGDNQYFVMGDNRLGSEDSRGSYGPINSHEIKGVTNFRLFPFTKFGKID